VPDVARVLPTVSVVMAAHDEEAFLEAAVKSVAAGLRERADPFEIIVVENGSTDATGPLARRLSDEIGEMRVISLPAADYGRALRAGFLAATGATVVNFDVDYYDLGFLDRALEMLSLPDGPAMVLGTKRGAGAVDTRHWTRRAVTAGFVWLLRVGCGLGVSDTHGMKALRREPLRALAEACASGTDLFDTELVLRAERAGLRVAEIPVVVEETRPSRTSVLSRIPRTLLGLVKLRLALRGAGTVHDLPGGPPVAPGGPGGSPLP